PSWGYVCPEVHVSFFEPETMARALEAVGLRPEFRRFLPGYEEIIRYKVLKALRVRRRHLLERALPWSAVARIVDWRLAVSGHPIAWKPIAPATLPLGASDRRTA
ncbi:MAG: hypothetical protein JOZ69_11335, partial [Myxococcales bacterium]|nr:hypothetical protein [Myxococcales bacterium]